MRRALIRAADSVLSLSGVFSLLERRALSTPRRLILCYHRILDAPDIACSANLALRPRDFDAQLDIVTRSYENVGLAELLEYRGAASVFAITFDDGFRDNITAAVPILKARDLRAAFFITTGAVGSSRLLWQNRLQAYLRLRPDPTRGPSYYAAVRGRLMTLPARERDELLERVRVETGADEPEIPELMMTEEHLRALDAAGMEILPHTVTHPRLAALSDRDIVDEIESSRRALERILGHTVRRIVAYPFGDAASVPENIEALLGPLGYEAGFIVKRDFYEESQGGRFHIPRIGVDRDDSPHIFRLKKLLPVYA